MPGRETWQFTKDSIAMPYVEFGCLEAECIQEYIFRATLSSLVFDSQQETMAVSETPKLILDPHEIQVQPIPVDFS